MANKRARTNEVHANSFMDVRDFMAKKRRLPVNNGSTKRHISQSLDPRLHPPHYPDPFRSTTPPVSKFHNIIPYTAAPPFIFHPYVQQPEPMDWQTSVYAEYVTWQFPQSSSEEETPMDWE
uniref:Uncharacterized protein n=1 Tax=Branchiostoma floridae TaxID=7739 RepID=C3YMS2_BRAFL|eukprot:XP_002602401.1 hypothetical protein BRAFLDRAFT_63508 [Branchiostoma floridae]